MKKYNMKLKTNLILMSFLAVILTAGISQAALLGLDLGLPDITSNSTGDYSYSISDGNFTSIATPLTITFDGINLIPIINASYSVSFYVDNLGNLTDGDIGNDLEIYGEFTYKSTLYSGLLLYGEVTAFGFQDLGWGNYAIFDYTFDVDSGSFLYDFFGPKGGDVAFVEQDNDWDGTWDDNHSGLKVKHDTAPIPIPSTVWIFGTGLIGLVGIRRKLRS